MSDVLQLSSRTTLTKYLNELVAARILIAAKDGREVFYINEDLIRILEGQ
ncbi:MAG TPA: hypothetical protein H9825_13445 [Candidatus Sphingobacterium stercorigallinarum]|nr:hypothetical protein [Candidatus Sphingobacterium stercorigallinarum]